MTDDATRVRRSAEAPLRVRERPILFSGPMVRAILEGRKTQTRRVIKVQPNLATPVGSWRTINGRDYSPFMRDGCAIYCHRPPWRCPFGKPGERLWVKETWAQHCSNSGLSCLAYRAGGANVILYDDTEDPVAIAQEIEIGGMGPPKWRPSIFMPRWASRVTLEITGVRVERVQDITKPDVKAEGFKKEGNLWQPMASTNPIYAYQLYWNLLNEDRGFGWEKNPWVWVIEFSNSAALARAPLRGKA